MDIFATRIAGNNRMAAAGSGGGTSKSDGDEEREVARQRRKVRLASTGLFRIDATCQCHDRDYPPWTGEIHGMSQALMSKSIPLRVFWWMVLVLCISCGTATTILVIIEYLRGPTATSTTIRLVPSLELPAITVCPKVPDAFDFDALFLDMQKRMPDLNKDVARDLISFWIGGSGLENMDGVPSFNHTYLQVLGDLYEQWRQGMDTKTFFHQINANFGYKCDDLFSNCEIGGKPQNCCTSIFQPRPVMRRGLCFQTRRNINQTEADDIGRLVLEIKATPSATSPQYNFVQPQIIIYVNDNFEQVLDFPRFYLYPHEWNRMHFTARYIELLEHPNDCTNRLFGKDANCFVRNWLSANVIDPYNCTVPYLEGVRGVWSRVPICDPRILAREYYRAIQLVHSGSVHSQECIPGCSRWEYSVSLQQSPALQPFEHHEFNLEISFYDLQYEHVKEVYTISVPGFMSQIGGQFGFFLGLSIITMIQITIYAFSAVLAFLFKLPSKVVQKVVILFKPAAAAATNAVVAAVVPADPKIDVQQQKVPEQKINMTTTTTAMFANVPFGGENNANRCGNVPFTVGGIHLPDSIGIRRHGEGRNMPDDGGGNGKPPMAHHRHKLIKQRKTMEVEEQQCADDGFSLY